MYTTTTNMAACQEIFFVALLLFSLVSKVLSASGTHETFEIKPNGQLTHAKASLEDGTVCVFTYSATGGTNEEWEMVLAKVNKEKGVYTCIIERPQRTSYLYFMKFTASILGKEVTKAEVYDSDGALLQEEEFVVERDGVRSKDGGFRSKLVKIQFSSL